MRAVSKVLGACLVTSVVLVSAGCGNAGENSESNTSDPNSPITFTFFGADASPNWNKMQDAVGKKITEETGVSIDAEFDISERRRKRPHFPDGCQR